MVFHKKGVLRNFAKFTGKRLCQSLFFNKVAGLTSATLLKKRLWRRCFPVNFAKFLRKPFLTEHLWWLLLKWTSLNFKSGKFHFFSVPDLNLIDYFNQTRSNRSSHPEVFLRKDVKICRKFTGVTHAEV